MNDKETMCFLLEAILRKANKTRVCPVCDIPYVDAKHALAHCRDKAKRNPNDAQHKGIGCVNTERDFKGFLTSLREAVGWCDMPESELPLTRGGTGPTAYGDCLEISWVVKMKSRLDTSQKKNLLQKIVTMAEIYHACPICLYGSATGRGVLRHCGEVDDTDHKGLLSKDQKMFLEFYEKAMGRTLEHAKVRITYDGAGNPEFENCFKLDEILQFKARRSRDSELCNLLWQN